MLTRVKLSVMLWWCVLVKLGFVFRAGAGGGTSDVQWCFSQVKGAIDDDVAEGKCMLWSLNSS